MLKEIWKEIPGFSNYQVSNLGDVKRVSKKEKILKKQLAWNKQYLCVGLYDDNRKYHKFLIHRLVAKVFIPNPNNYEIVNHKDENKFNNCVGNLEWVSIKQNNIYSYNKHPERNNKVQVLQYDLEGNFIKKWNSITEVSNYFNVYPSLISRCLKGITKSYKKYLWRYYSDNFPSKIEEYSKNSKYRKINQYNLKGEFIKTWDSMVQIEKTLDIKIHGINDCCKGILKSSGNYIWKFYC